MKKYVKIRTEVDGFEYVHWTSEDQIPEGAEIVGDDEPFRSVTGGDLDSIWWSNDPPNPDEYAGEQAKGQYSGTNETLEVDEYLAERDRQKQSAQSVSSVSRHREVTDDAARTKLNDAIDRYKESVDVEAHREYLKSKGKL